jgi:hypothetical protein
MVELAGIIGVEMKAFKTALLIVALAYLAWPALYAQQDEQKALDELRDLSKAPETKIFKLLNDKFLSQIKEDKLRESLLIMFISNPPTLVISPEYLPEYIPDNYTIYAPSEDSPAVPYLLGQYICHVIYGKEKYKELSKNLLIKDNLNILIQLQNPLWFKPEAGKPNPLQDLIKDMNYRGVWLHDLANFFAKVITREDFDKPLWLLDKKAAKDEVAEIDQFWQRMIPEKTEGYALSVLNDIYDHEMFRDLRYYPDDDPINIINGLDTILAVLLSKNVNDFTEFELAYSEMFGNLEQVFRETILLNNWQLRLEKKAEEDLVKDYNFPKIIIHPQLEPETEFDRRQKICSDYQKKVIVDNKGYYVQFLSPVNYILSKNTCEGIYYILEIVKMDGNNAEAKVKKGPIEISMDLDAVKMSLNWSSGGKNEKDTKPVQEPAFPPADEESKDR